MNKFEELHQEVSEQAKNKADKLHVQVDIPQLMEGLMGRYTMKSEQSIHMASLGLASIPDSQTKSSKPNRADDEIEFFEIGAGLNFPFRSSNDFEDLGIDLFGGPIEVPSKKDPNSEYGDNVELF